MNKELSKYELEKLNNEAVRAGFSSYQEKLDLIKRVNTESVQFKRWEHNYCTKEALMEIVENKPVVDLIDLCEAFPSCHYHINLNLSRLKHYFEEHWGTDPYKFHSNPKFQRDYVWTEEQQIAYMEFMVREPHDNKARSIMLNSPEWDTFGSRGMVNMYLVDGLQRYTAINKFLNDEFSVYGYKFSQFNARSRRQISGISMDIYVNNLSYKDMLRWYVDLNSGGTVHTYYELNKVRKMIEEME